MRAMVAAGLTLAVGSVGFGQVRDYPAQAAPLTAVRLMDGFWAPRLEVNHNVTLWHVFNQCEAQGEFDNFAKAAGKMPGGFKGSSPARDSDAYKTIEGAAYILATTKDAKLEKYVDDLIANIVAAQEADGYIYTARKITPADQMPAMSGKERFINEKDSHETYVMGLLQEAGVAYFQATGKKALMDAGVKSADFLNVTFGPGDKQLHDASGHEEIEMALARLYQATGDQKYLALSEYFVDQRGKRTPSYGAYAQDNKPVADQTDAVGHAVRAGYLYCGLTDLVALTGNAAYAKADDALWHSVVDRKMYLTGGVGARGNGEAFGNDYELPNLTAYNETCAAIANAFWQERLFLLYQDAKYADVLERILYNGFLGGISLSGDRFFYTNALESDGTRGKSQRMPWFQWPCCLTNDVRIMPSIPGYMYATDKDGAWVNLFASGTADLKFGEGGGKSVRITQETDYPWDGKVRMTVNGSGGEFALRVRIPGWAQGKPVPGDLYSYAEKEVPAYTLKVNGEAVKGELEKGYAVIKRAWGTVGAGDVVELELPMPVHRVLANGAVAADRGRVALERGPIVYCAEGVDNGGSARNLVLPAGAELTSEYRKDLLNGVVVVHAKSGRVGPAAGKEIVAVPYFAWSNRGNGEMVMWMNAEGGVGN